MSKPKRIQKKRTKGWKMPEGAVSVTRPSKWGNPFTIGEWFMRGDCRGDRSAFRFTYTHALSEQYADERYTKISDASMAVEWFRWYLSVAPPRDLVEIRGKNLACWCPLDQPCHADVLLEIANAAPPESGVRGVGE